MPITGASLPFFSYGGTALLILLGEVGILLSVSHRLPVSKE
jgi:cell division protein FtsW